MPVMSPTLGAYLKYEAPSLYSRDNVTVAAGQNLAVGTVVGRITASGQITALAPAATDGSQNAIGIMAMTVDATAGAKPGVIIARHAEIVDSNGLVWAGSPTQPQKDAAVAAMKALGILARTTL